jgi:predicted nucleic acid-binding protein
MRSDGENAHAFALDSNCLIALLCAWHAHHERTAAAYDRFRKGRHKCVLPVQAWLETFSVITRLPSPYRVDAATARSALNGILDNAVLVCASPSAASSAVDAVMASGAAGSRVYDALIAYSAHEAGAEIMLTWNAKHFKDILPPGLSAVEP